MAHELLECQELLTMSKLSDTAIGDWITIDQGQIALVAVADWILPKDAFVMAWYWFMLDAKIYHKNWDCHKWDPIISDLNKNKINETPKLKFITNSKSETAKLLEIVYGELYNRYNKHGWSVTQKKEIFTQVIHSLARS